MLMLIRIESTAGFRTHARNPTTNDTAIKNHGLHTEETEFLKELNKHNKNPTQIDTSKRRVNKR